MKPIRVLHENVIMDQGGIENFIMNVYHNIDRERIQFDFMVHRSKKGYFDDEIRRLGGRIFVAPPFNPLKHYEYLNGMKRILADHPEFKIIHCHSELNMWPLRVAKSLGIPVRIAHSHNAKTKVNLKYMIMRYQQLFIKKYCTDMFMCSDKAGEWAFGRETILSGKAYVVKNGIEMDKFIYNEAVRESVRHKFNIENKFVIGHVGRFMEQKNHEFLIDVFKEVLEQEPNAVLLLIGEGELKNKIRKKVEDYRISDSVIFAGVRSDVNELMQAMDVFALPSLWEGLGIVLVEAQAAGLPCIVSDVVPRDTDLSDNIRYIVLGNTQSWAENMLKFKNVTRGKNVGCIVNAGYDVRKTVEFLTDFYLNQSARDFN